MRDLGLCRGPTYLMASYITTRKVYLRLSLNTLDRICLYVPRSFWLLYDRTVQGQKTVTQAWSPGPKTMKLN